MAPNTPRQATTAADSLATGRELVAAGRFEDAARVLGAAVQHDPGLFEAHLLLAKALQRSDRIEEAIASLQNALAINPASAEVFVNLGSLCARLGALEDAAFMLRQALELEPAMIEAENNLALVLYRQKQFDEAEALLVDALARAPDRPELHATLGSVFSETGRLAEALAHMEKAVELRPDYGEAYSNLGNVLRDLGRIDDAHAAYGRALDLIPSNAHAHVNHGVALLLTGDFAAGWEEYEWRLETPEARDVSGLPPRWDGEPLDGKSILVYTEQGVGDVVMFASILPDLIDTGAKVHLWSTDRLTALLARSYPNIVVDRLPEVTAEGKLGDDAPALDGIDFSVALASLPRIFRRSRGDFDDANNKTGGRTLTPDGTATERWGRRYQELGPGLKIGISWRGGSSQWDKRLRTTRLDDWTELFELPDVVWINLQYGDRAAELSNLEGKTGHKVHDWPDAVADLDDFASQVDALDLVVSMGNTTVHFAGALAKPVCTLVPAVSAWRWGLSGDDCPWYPTMRLIRQGEGQPWDEVLAPLASDIADFK